MQSRCFDICPTVKIHTLQKAVCPRAAWVFSPCTMEMSHWDMWKATAPLEPLENTGGNPSLTKKKKHNTSHSYCKVCSCVCPAVCDDNVSRKEGNDFVSDSELIYEGLVNWRLLWGDVYCAALLQDVWLSSSCPPVHMMYLWLKAIFSMKYLWS